MMHQHRSPKICSVGSICVCRKAEEEFSIADDDWECHSCGQKETQTGPSHRKCAAGRLHANSYGKEAMPGLLQHDEILLKRVEMYTMNQHDVSKTVGEVAMHKAGLCTKVWKKTTRNVLHLRPPQITCPRPKTRRCQPVTTTTSWPKARKPSCRPVIVQPPPFRKLI